MDFAEWLELTGELQKESFGVRPADLAADPEALGDYLHLNITGAFDEVSEMADEVGWKPWAKNRGWIHRTELVQEAADVLHFVANLLWIAGVSGEELAEAYRRKVSKNARRQAEGYTQRGAPEKAAAPDIMGRDL